MSSFNQDKIWRAAFEKVSDFNGPVELTPTVSDDPVVPDPVIRSRLMRFDAKGITVERPDDVDDRRALRQGRRVELLLVDGNQRWMAVTEVVGFGELALNERMSVQTVELAAPRSVTSAQRRDYFRVSTAGIRMDPVTLHPAGEPQTEEGVMVDGLSKDPFDVAMVNLGGGGMGVRVQPPHVDAATYFSEFQAVLRLPVPDGGLSIPAKVVHRQMSYNGTLYIGFNFEYDGAAMKRQCEDVICHFTTDVQRQQLARQRGGG